MASVELLLINYGGEDLEDVRVLSWKINASVFIHPTSEVCVIVTPFYLMTTLLCIMHL